MLPKDLEDYDHIDIVYHNNVMYILHVKNNCFNIHMMYESPSYKICDNNDKYVTISTENENVVLPLELLFKRSALIKGLFSDISDIPDSLLYESYVNMKIYKDFVVNNNIEKKNLYNLYHICNYLNDIEINYVSELIVLHVRENNLSIEESFKFLELLSTSLCDNQLDSLLYMIILKYNIKDVYNEIGKYKNSKMYDFVVKQLLNVTYNFVHKHNS